MEDQETTKLAQQGSEEAISLLVKKYQIKVFRLAWSFTRNREAADDLSQEIFLKAFRALPTFRFKSEFGTWLYRVAINTVQDFLRKKGRHREVSLDDVGELSASDDSAERRESEERDEAMRDQLYRALETLPAKYRIVLTLRDIQGLPYNEIVRILKVSPGTVDSRIFRARKMLRRKLAPALAREGGR